MANEPKDAASEGPPLERWRFKVRRKSDGTEITGPVLAIPKGWGRLGTPHFHSGDVGHGDWAWMIVPAPGLEGKKVKFRVQCREKDGGGKWQPFEEAVAPVESGEARAMVRLRHPEHKDGTHPVHAEEVKHHLEFRFFADLL